MPYAYCEQIGKEIRDISDEIPFDIPESWEWCRLDTIFQHNTGKALNSSKTQGTKMQYITTSNLYWNRFELDKLKEMPFTESEIEKCTVSKGDLLVCEGGDIGRAAIWTYNYPMRIQNHIHRVRPYLQMNIYFFYYVFFLYKGVGLIGGKGIGIQGLSTNALGNLLLPLPPLAEQKRIIEKIEELLPYIEKYEKAETELSQLNKSFPDMLKKSILQEAVQGKLVPQNPDDEPASVLLERIRAEKQELIKQGKIKKDKHESVIVTRDKIPYEISDGKERCIADEVPFEIPESWCWCRLCNIVYNSGQIKPSSAFCYIDIGSIDNKKQKLGNTENIIEAENAPSRARKIVNFGDIIYSTVRPYLHNMCIIDKTFSLQPIASTGFAVMTCYNSLFNKYLFYYLLSPDFDNYANDIENSKGVAYPAINDIRLYKSLIPLPPLAEQKRIVEKIEELIKICNML